MTKNTSTTVLLSLTLLSSLVSLTACDKVAEKATEAALEKVIESETGEKIDIDTDSNGEMTIKTKEGTITTSEEGEQFTLKDTEGNVAMASGENVEVPKEFPKDVVIPEGFTAESFMKLEQKGYMLMGTVKGSIDSVNAELNQKLTTAGWSEAEPVESPYGMLLSKKKGDTLVNYILQKEGDKTSIMITAGSK